MQHRIVVSPEEIMGDTSNMRINEIEKEREKVKEEVLNRVFQGEFLSSIEEISDTPWGEPHSWYTPSGNKFSHRFAMVSPEEWVNLHNAIGHGRAGAKPNTVERVKRDIENDDVSGIPTPPLALSPDEYNTDPIVYTVEHEGRSRGVGALEAGIEKMPVVVAVRRYTK